MASSLVNKIVRVKLTAETGKLVGGYVLSTGTVYFITTPLRTLEIEVPRDAEITDYLEEIRAENPD
jgi:hypothetical protein